MHPSLLGINSHISKRTDSPSGDGVEESLKSFKAATEVEGNCGGGSFIDQGFAN